MDFIMNFVKHSYEWRYFGGNLDTIGAAGIIVFTLIEGWGLFKQSELIWKNRSGASVSVSQFSFLMSYFYVLFIYGFGINSISVMLNGLVMGCGCIAVLIGLWIFKGYNRTEKEIFLISSLAIPAMTFLPWREEIYLFMTIGTLFALASQPFEIWRYKYTGSVSLSFLVTVLISTIFWTIFAFCKHDGPLEFMSIGTLAIIMLTIYFWNKYKKPEIIFGVQEQDR